MTPSQQASHTQDRHGPGRHVLLVGAGAIGTWAAASLAKAGHRVTVMARSPASPLWGLREFSLTRRDKTQKFDVEVVAALEELDSPPDLILVCVKTYDLTSAAESIVGTPHTVPVVIAHNGLPFWCSSLLPPGADAPLASLDPGGRIAAALGTERVMTCVVQAAARLERPGHVVHLGGRRLTLGLTPVSRQQEMLDNVGSMLDAAGFETTVTPDIAAAIWAKLAANTPMNALGALAGLTLGELATGPGPLAVAERGIAEMSEIARALGITVTYEAAELLNNARRAAEHKPSMLQDVEAGRPLEIDAIVNGPIELAQRVGVKTPVLDGLAKLLNACFPSQSGLRS
jgi:2-dehydropantoate 2-reductase